jgi:hypothetical protein
MHLSTARLCLDCDEIHDAQTCPACASNAFTFLSRWVPAPEPRRNPAPSPPEVAVYRSLIHPEAAHPPRRGALLKKGVIGLTAVGVFGWLWRSSQAGRKSASPDDAERSSTSP